MSAKKFKFVSPGVFLSEIDNSQLPKAANGVGPVIIGRTRRGPALKPVKVNSFQEFVEIFGEPIAGNETHDAWREGNGLAATAYAPYAAQAYLKADINSPATIIRLAGIEGDDSGDTGEAGWTATDAYGLFFAVSSSAASLKDKLEAHLGAIIYTDNASFKVGVKGNQHISGTLGLVATSSYVRAGAGAPVGAVQLSGKSFTLLLQNASHTVEKTVTLREGPGYIRDVLNTNPVATNDKVMAPPAASLAADYWLGETFEEEFEALLRTQTDTSADKLIVFPMKLSEGMEDFKSVDHQLAAASTGWVFPQYIGASGSYIAENQQRLFRLHALQEGEQGMDLSVHIEDISIPGDGSPTPFGSFSLVVKQRRDDRIVTIESFSDLNLNPNSNNFIARRVGDQYFEWDASQKRNKLYGGYPNQSSYVRVEMNLDVEENGPSNPASVPFGYYGPIVHDDVGSGTIIHTTPAAYRTINYDASTAWVTGALIIDDHLTSLTFKWPEVPHVVSGSKATGFGGRFVMGHSEYDKHIGDGTLELFGEMKQNFGSVNRGMRDFLRRMGTHNNSAVLAAQKTGLRTANTKYSYIFSLDDVSITGSTSLSSDMSGFNPEFVVFRSGSHIHTSTDMFAETYKIAFTSMTGSDGLQLSASALLDVVSGFAMPMVGGFDGVNITEADPFNMSTRAGCVGPDATTKDNYAYASIDRAIELIKDPEAIEMNLAVMPGITNKTLTEKLIQTCEARADAMAIIDLPDVYIPPAQKKCDSFKDRVNTTNAAKSAKALRARKINSSYGAAYYPWVKVKDTISNRDVWVPPSVIALGVMGYTEQRDEVWFAPAGFNRGGLNEGNAGLKVLQASEQLLSSERDTLYAANINPIASFVSEGLVVFGQKTLQSTASALDRINVRRLLIFVKKEISRISNGLLFDQNVPATWARFTGQVVPFLESVKTRLGLTDFKVILDNTTTTPDLVDRNIMYAKIFLKPARAIEFIAVDFVITRSGASFDD